MNSNKSNGQLTAQINVSDHKKSGFDLSNNNLGTGQIGRIIPTRALHVMPGDTIKQDSKVAIQFEPLAVPILSNMDVKQEHFYVTYNSIWDNWDKFISGGEKMDYQGVVPNITLKHIFRIIDETFFQDPQTSDEYLYLNLFRIPTTDVDDETDICFTKKILDFSAAKSRLDTIGDKYYIKDILRPQYEALSNLVEAIEKFVPVNSTESTPGTNYIAWKIIHYDSTTLPTDDESLQLFVEEQLRKYCDYNVYVQPLVEVMASTMTHYGYNIAIPTNEFMEILIHMYNFIKSFVGVSSNIDYLNMNRLVPTDLLYMYFLSVQTEFVAKIQDGTYAPATQLNINIKPSALYLSEMPMSILNLRANYLVWFNNYRDILLEADAYEPQNTDAITDDELFVLLVPRQRCWEKDAFTTALDNPGTGNVGVQVGANAAYAGNYHVYSQDGEWNNDGEPNEYANNIYKVEFDGSSWDVPTAYLTGINSKITENAVETNGFSLYQLDAAQRAQKWLQKALFFGNRISDFYYMHFGVRYLDARLRLPELLASSSQLVKIDTIMNNTTTAESIAGDRAGFASAYDDGQSFDRFCEEHGVILSYMTVMPQITYAYGTNRDYSRLDQFDFAFSEFATLGMDAVYDSEITNATMDIPEYQTVQVFGYQGKYYDYKAKHSEEHGELLTTQDMYTFARKFNMYGQNGRPKLNYEFVHCFPDLDMFVVDSALADYFRYDIRHSTAAERILPSQSLYI